MSLHRECDGVDIDAHAYMVGHVYVPSVILTWHKGDCLVEVKLNPPCDKLCATEDEAVLVAMDYGLDAVNGFVPGFDPFSLRK
jgi:hypothetical protein